MYICIYVIRCIYAYMIVYVMFFAVCSVQDVEWRLWRLKHNSPSYGCMLPRGVVVGL